MQTVAIAVRIVSFVTGTDRARVNQISRGLINAGLLPKSSGRAVKKISSAELFYLVAATAMADKIHDGPTIALGYARLPLQVPDLEGDQDGAKSLDEPTQDLQRRFQLAMELPNCVPLQLSFSRSGQNGERLGANFVNELRGKDGEAVLDLTMPFWTDKSWGSFTRSTYEISKEGMQLLRSLFTGGDLEKDPVWGSGNDYADSGA